MPRLISALLYCTLLISCTNEKEHGAAPRSPQDKELHSFLASYYETMSSRDWRKYREFFWENATLTTSWKNPQDSAARVHILTIDEFIAETPAGPDSKPIFKEEMKTALIDVEGNLASAWVDYDVEFGTRDSLMRWSGTDVFTFLKNDGDWRIASLVFESN